jgi:hypothetical protein
MDAGFGPKDARKRALEYERRIEENSAKSLPKKRNVGKGDSKRLKERLEHFKECGYSQGGIEQL